MTSYISWTFCGLLLLAAQTYAVTETSDGDGGVDCGSRKCVENQAFCNANGVCECIKPPYYSGLGDRACYKNNTFHTEVANDPEVLTYNDFRLSLPMPCRYCLTSTITWLKDRQRKKAGTCTLKVYAFQQKYKGKLYVSGYDFAIKIEHKNNTVKNISMRMYGLAKNGQYEFYVNGTDDQFYPNGPWGNMNIVYNDPNTGLKIEFEYDKDQNLAILYAKKCGIRFQFRPYDAGLRQAQPYVPHVAYSINCAYHPEFFDKDTVVAIPPRSHNNGLDITSIPPLYLGWEEKLFLRALNSGAWQNSPEPNTMCDYVKNLMNSCSVLTMKKAFRNCMFLLESPRFMRCFDDTFSGEKIMELFGKCVKVHCHGGSCADLIDDIEATDCQNKEPYDTLTRFLNPNNQCDPHP